MTDNSRTKNIFVFYQQQFNLHFSHTFLSKSKIMIKNANINFEVVKEMFRSHLNIDILL